jgi:hypothetical protein
LVSSHEMFGLKASLYARRRKKFLRYLCSILKTPGFKMLPLVFLIKDQGFDPVHLFSLIVSGFF